MVKRCNYSQIFQMSILELAISKELTHNYSSCALCTAIRDVALVHGNFFPYKIYRDYLLSCSLHVILIRITLFPEKETRFLV